MLPAFFGMGLHESTPKSVFLGVDRLLQVLDENNRIFDVFNNVSTVNVSTVDSTKFLDIGTEHKYF